MDTLTAAEESLFMACRIGDLEKVRQLLECCDVSPNLRDCWDSTPLYYACLCGHEMVVDYLLQRGASCAENTFDGERCVYGALTDRISKMLRSYRALTFRVASRNPFEEAFRRLLESGHYSDMEFVFHPTENHSEETSLSAHKCILMARSPYFFKQFMGEWRDKSRIPVRRSSGITRQMMSLLLHFIYTGRLEIPFDMVDDIKRVSERLGLSFLADNLQQRFEEVQRYMKKKDKNAIHISLFPFEDRPWRLRRDFGFLAKHALPSDLLPQIANELPFPEEQVFVLPDIIFDVHGHRFACHKAFMCGRSEFFSALINFNYDTDENVVRVTSMPTAIFTHILHFIYQDSCDPVDVDEALSLLDYAEMCFLPSLKSRLVNYLEKNCLNVNTACVLFCASREHGLTRLENLSSAFMASQLDYFLEDETFKELVLMDANSLEVREECDTIDVIDQIRYHLSVLNDLSDSEVAARRLTMLDSFLEDLNLFA